MGGRVLTTGHLPFFKEKGEESLREENPGPQRSQTEHLQDINQNRTIDWSAQLSNGNCQKLHVHLLWACTTGVPVHAYGGGVKILYWLNFWGNNWAGTVACSLISVMHRDHYEDLTLLYAARASGELLEKASLISVTYGCSFPKVTSHRVIYQN